MKKSIFYSIILLFSFFSACDEKAKKTEVKTENSGTNVKEPVSNKIETNTEANDSKKTSVSVGSGGTDVEHKNTQIKVDKNRVKVGSKNVEVDINR